MFTFENSVSRDAEELKQDIDTYMKQKKSDHWYFLWNDLNFGPNVIINGKKLFTEIWTYVLWKINPNLPYYPSELLPFP